MSSVTLVHPTKAVGRNEIPFRRDTPVVQSNIVLDRSPGPPTRRGDLGSEPPICNDAAYCPITLGLVIIVIRSWRAGYETCRQSRSGFVTSR